MNLHSITLIVFSIGWSTVASFFLSKTADSSSALIVAPVYQGDSEFYVDLHCGTPPQRQTVTINTDAPTTVIPCTGCDDCGAQHTLFDQPGSMTFDEIRCNSPKAAGKEKPVPEAPGQHSVPQVISTVGMITGMAKEVTDFCFVGSETAVIRTEFACQTSTSGVFRSQYPDGTLSLSRSSPRSLISQLYQAGKIQNQEFSLCLRPSVQERSSEAGALTLGGSDNRLHSTPMVYAQMQGEDHYGVRIRKIHLKTHGLRTLQVSEETLNEGTVVIESGISHSFFTGTINNFFRSAWKELTGENFDEQPRYVSYNQVAELPTIVIQLVGVDKNPSSSTMLANDPEHPTDVLIEITPQQYMEYNDQTGEYINKFALSHPKTKRTILGANVMRGYDVSFDIANRRIGWAESRCVLDEDGIPMPEGRSEEPASKGHHASGATFRSVGLVIFALVIGVMLATKLSLKKYVIHNRMYTAAPTEFMELELRSVDERSFHYEQPSLAIS